MIRSHSFLIESVRVAYFQCPVWFMFFFLEPDDKVQPGEPIPIDLISCAGREWSCQCLDGLRWALQSRPFHLQANAGAAWKRMFFEGTIVFLREQLCFKKTDHQFLRSCGPRLRRKPFKRQDARTPGTMWDWRNKDTWAVRENLSKHEGEQCLLLRLKENPKLEQVS